MDKKTVFFVSVLSLLCVLFLSTTVVLYVLREREIEKSMLLAGERDFLRSELKRSTEEKEGLSKKLKNEESKRLQLQSEVERLKKQTQLLRAQLESERSRWQEASWQSGVSQEEYDQLLKRYQEAIEQQEGLKRQIDKIQSSQDLLKVRLQIVQRAKEALEEKLSQMISSREVGLGKIVVTAHPTPMSESNSSGLGIELVSDVEQMEQDKEGHILVVNRRFDFAVVDLGSQDGIKPGTDLAVYRDGKLLATLQVEKVHTTMSAAKLPPEWKGVDLREGDKVSVLK